MDQHPDIRALRERYEETSETVAARLVAGLSFMAGLYAAISAWVIGFDGQGRMAVSNLVVGIAVAVLALGMASAYERTHGLAWVSALLGVWLIVSPWLIDGVDRTAQLLWSNIVVGAVVVVLGLAGMAMEMGAARRRPML
ncbi:MAG: hypothetical protein EPO13_09515 [Actinomycetota bacterium]|nr:MAG: hypothetical protein EPO13_09515 [Actinomycetota bacterium]